jgi:hypothetical protein
MRVSARGYCNRENFKTAIYFHEALSAIRQAALDTEAAPSVTNQPGHNIPLGTLAGAPNAFLRSGRR